MQARNVSLVVFALALALPGVASAEDASKPDYAAAKRHFKAGQEFLQTDRYAEAVVEFKQAYEITKDGLVLGQVAQAFARGGDYEQALAHMRLYRDSLPEGERASADQLIKEYEKAVNEGRSKHLVLPGEAPEKAPVVETKTPEPATQPVPAEEPPPPPKTHRLYTWIAAGLTGALAISALVVGLNAQSKYDELSNSCSPRCAQSDVDSVKSRALTSDVLWGTAAAAAVTTVVLYFVEGRSVGGETKEPGGEVEEESLSRRLRLTPVVGAGSYGLGAGLRF